METILTFNRAPTQKHPTEMAKNKASKWKYALACQTLVPTNHSDSAHMEALRFHWGNHMPRDVITITPHHFLFKFNNENDLKFVLNEGSWAYSPPSMVQAWHAGTRTASGYFLYLVSDEEFALLSSQ